MARTGVLPTGLEPCRCESPVLDRLGFIHLTNEATYRVYRCQRCGQGYDSVRDSDPLPGDAPILVWPCPICGAANLVGPRGCSNCPAPEDEWECRACHGRNHPSQDHCAQCQERRWSPGGLLIV